MALQPVFLLSLPRSGSTLLQRMLGAHPAISTRAEPWLLLPLLAALDEQGVYTRYNHRVAQRAVRSFTGHLTGGEDAYLEQVRQFALGLYEQAAEPDTTLFLDKTPRYGLYIERLLRTFPSAPIVVLWRNPLAILASLSRSWLGDQWMPYLHTVDLYDLLDALTAAVVIQPHRFCQLRYEDLVRDPQAALRPVVSHLDLPWHDHVANNFAETDVRGPVGDTSGSLTHQGSVSAAATDRWRSAFASPVRRRWAAQYLDWIGSERLQVMGYDHADLRQQLARTPTRWSTVPADLAYIAKGLAWRVTEPQILKDKWSRRYAPFSITSHS